MQEFIFYVIFRKLNLALTFFYYFVVSVFFRYSFVFFNISEYFYSFLLLFQHKAFKIDIVTIPGPVRRINMRIGEFASKFNISQSAIRYYISEGILVPSKRNSQYVFSDSDAKELEVILKLKSLHFSIDEIQEYLRVLRLYNSFPRYSIKS